MNSVLRHRYKLNLCFIFLSICSQAHSQSDSSLAVSSADSSIQKSDSLVIPKITLDWVDIKFDLNEIEWNASYVYKSKYSKEGALTAIKEGKLQILFSGGFGGMPDFENQRDILFQQKYKVDFYSQGCVRYGLDDDEEGYNSVILDYLDSKYGKDWRYEIRNGAIGFDPPNLQVVSETAELKNFGLILHDPKSKTKTTVKKYKNTSSPISIFLVCGIFLLVFLILINRPKAS